jgi:hydrogenase expression/formation protein HypE
MDDIIRLGHGSGGKLMNQLIQEEIGSIFSNSGLQLDDSAVLNIFEGKIAFTTDSYTITPIFFNGGDIGSLAINGTVNDLAVMGAQPLYLSSSLIVEEGFTMENFRTVLCSMNKAAQEAHVQLVTGDTKVVERGKGDGIFINTAGIGIFNHAVQRGEIKVGDKILINGTIGDHGITIMAMRNNLSVSQELKSDCAPLNHLIQSIIERYPARVKFMRDATRGGVASVLNEVVAQQPFAVQLFEEEIPLRDEVRGVCDILGIDPLYAANEGKIVMVVEEKEAEQMVQSMAKHPAARGTKMIGQITDQHPGKVFLETEVGGKRMVPLLLEDQLPRIC